MSLRQTIAEATTSPLETPEGSTSTISPHSSPLAFVPTEKFIDLVCRAESLPEEIEFEENLIRLYLLHPDRRLRCYIANHADEEPSHEDIWDFTVDNIVYVAEMNSSVKRLKQEHDQVLQDLKNTWEHEREAWREKALKATAGRSDDSEERWHVDLWLARMERIDEKVKEFVERR